MCGSFDVPLSEAGRDQLEALVRGPASRPAPAALVTTRTLRRAHDVAAVLGRAWTLEPQPAEWVREIHCGEVEGMPLEDVQHRFPELWARNEAQNDDTFAWPGGESYGDYRTRVIEGLRATVVIRGRPAAVWEPDRPQLLTATKITWHNGRTECRAHLQGSTLVLRNAAARLTTRCHADSARPESYCAGSALPESDRTARWYRMAPERPLLADANQ